MSALDDAVAAYEAFQALPFGSGLTEIRRRRMLRLLERLSEEERAEYVERIDPDGSKRAELAWHDNLVAALLAYGSLRRQVSAGEGDA